MTGLRKSLLLGNGFLGTFLLENSGEWQKTTICTISQALLPFPRPDYWAITKLTLCLWAYILSGIKELKPHFGRPAAGSPLFARGALWTGFWCWVCCLQWLETRNWKLTTSPGSWTLPRINLVSDKTPTKNYYIPDLIIKQFYQCNQANLWKVSQIM